MTIVSEVLAPVILSRSIKSRAGGVRPGPATQLEVRITHIKR